MKRIITLFTSIAITQVKNLILFPSMLLVAWGSQAQQATNINFQSVVGAPTSISINWTNGTGVGRIVVVKNNAGVFKPTDNANITTLNASLNYTAGTNDQDLGSGVAAVVFAGTGAGPITVTNLASGIPYHVQVYEFTDATASPDYILTTNTSNPKGFSFYTSGGTFSTPVDVTTANVQAWGGGGGAGGNTNSGTGALNGGGGGAYASSALTSLSGNYPVAVGSGGAGDGAQNGNGDPGGNSTFGTTLVVAAQGAGGGPGNQQGGAGGTTAASTGNTAESAGGNGGERTTGGGNGGGGGGGSAGTSGGGGNGGDAGTPTTDIGGSAGSAGAGGGAAGGAGANNGVIGNNGNFPGGGAGGRGSSNLAPGNGAGGLVIVSYNDITAPTATIIREPATSNTYSTNASVQFKVTFSEPVNSVSADGSDFSVAAGGTVTTGAITVTGSGPYIVSVATVGGDGTLDLNFAGGQNITDITGNAFSGTTTGDEIYNIDNQQPATFTVGNVTANVNAGGNVVSNFYNATNTAGITITVPIDNDATLIGGNIQFRIDKDGGASYNDLHVTFPISSVGSPQNFSIPHAGGTGLTNNSEYADTRTLTFTAVITDAAGNFRTGTESGTTLTVDLTGPSAPSTPDLLATDDSGLNTDNNTNVTSPTFNSTSNIANNSNLSVKVVSSIDGTIGTGTANGSGGYSISTTFVSQGSHSITVVCTDAQGNAGTSTALSPVIYDINPPPTPAAPNLQNGSDTGQSNSDDLTNDQTPSFDGVGSNGLRLELLEGSTVLFTIASANATTQTLTSTTLTNGLHNISLRSTDVAGNTATSSDLPVTIDAAAPSLTSLVPVQSPTTGLVLKTGTITVANAATAVSGSGTAFTTELFQGALLRTSNNTVIGTVATITDDNNLVLTSNTAAAFTGIAYYTQLYFIATFDGLMTSSTVTAPDFSETGVGTIGTVNPATTTGKSQIFYINDATFTMTGSSVINLGTNGYQDAAGNSANTGVGGTAATIDNTAPTVSSIVRKTPTNAYTQATTVTFTVTFAEPVTGVDDLDFTKTITGGGFTAGAITVNPVSATVYDVEVATIAAVNGTLRLDVPGSATIQDNLGNNFTAAFTGGQVYTFDYNNPLAFNVGTVVSTVGRIRPYHYNLTNTGVNVTVPIGSDPSLDGGSVQLMARLLPAGSFADVGSPSSISAVGVPKIISLNSTDLAAYLVDGNIIEFTAKITDVAGNGPITGTASTISLTVDLVRPSITVTPRVYGDKGGGPNNGGGTTNRDVIEFTVNEPLYNSATAGTITSATNSTTVTGVGTNFTKLVVGGVITNAANATVGTIQSIANDLSLTLTGNANTAVSAGTFKFRGLSVLLGLTTSTGTIGTTLYINDGTSNTVDNTLTNTRLIYIESNADNSGWTTTTNLIYTQSSGGSAAGNYLFDAAGNELDPFSLTCTNGDVIPPTVNPNVMTLSPRSTNMEKIVFTLSEALSTSTAPNAVTGFSTTGTFPDASIGIATYSEASPGVCPCTITLTSASDGAWNSGTHVWYDPATGNVLDLAGVPNELGTITNKAVVVETVAPSITSVTIPAAAMKVGSVVTATITVTNDDGDTPLLTTGTINGFPLSILNFSGSPTSKTVQFTVAENGADVLAGADIPIVNLVLTDGQGNASTPFVTPISQGGDPIDAHSPTITSITNTLTTIFEGDKTQTVTVVYNEPMNTAVQPAISLSGGSTHWGAQIPSGGTNGWVGNTYKATFLHDGFQEPANDPSISVQSSVAIGGAQDAAGNPNLGTLASSSFILDTKKPTATVSVSPSTINIANDILTVTVDFSKAMNTSVVPAISFNIGAGVSNFNPTGAGVWSNGNKKYVRSYQQLNSFNSLTNSVSVNSGQDVVGNLQTASAASGNFVIDRVTPIVSSVSRVTQEFTNLSSLQYTVVFSEAVTGLTNANFDFVVVSGAASGSVTGFTTSDNITYVVTTSIGVGSNGVTRLDVNTSGSAVDARSNPFVTGFITGQTYTVDTTPPTITNIVHNATLFNGWAGGEYITTPPYNGNQLDFTITFDEDVVGLADAHISEVLSSPSIGFPAVSFSPPTIVPVDAGGTPLIPSTLPSRYWKVTYTGVAGSGYIYIGFRNLAPLVKDKAGNNEVHTVTNFFGYEDDVYDYFYYVTLAAPTFDVADPSFTPTAVTNTSLSVQWDHSAGTQRATDYFIRAKQSNIGLFPASTNPADGTNPANDPSATDGILAQHFNSNAWPTGPAAQISTAFTGLLSGVDYDFEIYPYTLSDNIGFDQSIDYQTGTPATVTVNPTTANSATLSNLGATVNFSSLTTSGPLALAHLTNFRFRITDESTDQDNAPFKFSGLIIKRNTPVDAITGQDDMGDWTQAIQTAYLVDQATGLQIDSIATITPDQIIFAAIPSALGQLGYIADGTNKIYDLHIRLKKDLGPTLPAIIDGLNFAFYIDNASFTLNNTFDVASNSQRSTGLVGGQTLFTSPTSNQVTVFVEKLAFRQPGTPGVPTQPQAQIGLATPFSAVPVATRPTVRALDRNNNLDLGYGSTATITNTLGLSQSVGSLNFVGGVLALDPLSFTTHSASPTQIVVTASFPIPSVTSSAVNTFISNLTTITEGTNSPGAELANFTSITNSTPAGYNFDFRISDDVTADPTNFTNNDGLPTLIQTITIVQGANNGNNGGGADALSFDNWTKSILGAQLKAVGNVQTVSGSINSGSLVFNIPAGSFMENVPDGGATDYELRIWLRNPIDSTGAVNLRTILDNKDYSFAIDVSNIIINSAAPNNTSTKAAAGSASTADNTNRVEVHATKLKFPTHPASSQQYDAAITPSPVVWATDANGNIDLGYTGTPTVTTLPNGARTYPPLAGTNTLTNSSGTITFDNTGPDVYTLTSTGGGFSGDITRLVVSGGFNDLGAPVTNPANSNLFSLNYSNTSDLVRDGTFIHPTDIEYYLNREPTTLTVANSIPLDRFTLRDGGSTFNDPDGSKTRLQSITLNVTNHQNIRLIALFDETGALLQQRDFSGFSVTGDIVFNSLAVFEDDDNNLNGVLKKFTVRVSFTDNVAVGVNRDNQQINVSVVSATAAGVSSQLIAPLTIPGDNLGTDKNKIEVIATVIDFTTVPATASISVPIAPPNSPQIVVSARDAFANLDLDYNGTITIASNNNTANFHTLNDPVGSFAGGTFTYPANFQFDIGNGNVRLTIEAGAGSTANSLNATALVGVGLSPIISVISSFESRITYPTGYTIANIPNTIPYVNHQSANLATVDDSFELIRYAVADGTADGSAIGNQPGIPGDLDGATTVLNSLKIGVSNYTAIRSIAAYNHLGVRIVDGVISPLSGINGEVFFDFTVGSKEIIASDDAEKAFSIRATFQSSPTLVSDTMHIRVSLRSAVLGTGSKFYDPGSYVVGNPANSVTAPQSKNEIDVTATSLDFVAPVASPFAGVDEPVGPTYTTLPQPTTIASIVHARDRFGLLDLGFHNVSAAVSGASMTVTGTFNFSSGILNLDGMQYDNAGDGTLTVVAGGINSSSPVCGSCSSIPGQPVNVINVSVTPAASGVLTTSNIKGGTQGATIFGVTFTPDHSTTTQPSLSGFTFSFDFPYKTATTTIFKGFVVKEGNTDVETKYSGATVTEVSSTSDTNYDLIVVDFPTIKPELFDASTGSAEPLTFYLVVDVDLTANISTQNLTPQLIDAGYGDATDNNIILTRGTATANVIGQTYQFASTRPPVLQTSKESRTLPFRGQLNVDANIEEITLEFDVQVWSLDGKAELFESATNTKIANLDATNGVYVNSSTLPVDSIVYTINFLPGKSLQPDKVYYVAVAKGSFDNVTNTGKGVSDNGFNFYGGTSFNGTLYFKVSSTLPPILSSATSYFSNLTSGVFSTTFDKTGTAYYMVLDHNAYVTNGNGATNNPTIAEIIDSVSYDTEFPGSVVKTGRYEITQISSPQYVSFTADLIAGRQYDVWIYANSDAEPDTIASPQPYGAAPYAIGGPGPTIKITLPTAANIKQTKIPDYLLCPGSEVLLTQPIVLSELANNSFANALTQDFYLLLPTGFQFSGVEDGDLPTVQLNGDDFDQSSLDIEFINNTIVHIQYKNSTSTDLDNIIITDLKLIGTPGNSGDIKRFGGNATLPTLTNNKLASVTVTTNQPLKFTNSYSRDNNFSTFGFLPGPDLPPGEPAIIKAIPDNYIDPVLGGSIRLIPINPAANDFAPSEFLGNGVTNDVLNLGAVALDAAFDITINHISVNGCIVDSDEQYVVYDHVSPISLDLGITQAGQHIGSKQSLVNPNFQTNLSLPPGYAPSPSLSVDQINFGDIAGYKLLDLYATIPTNLVGAQIISGANWATQVSKIPVVVNTIPDATSPTTYKKDYKWDYTHIINAVQDNAGITKDPYDNFRDTTLNNTIYWTGGSLGKIEFTGRYQSTADLTLTVPFRQQVELYVPPIPKIEVSGQSAVLGNTAIFCKSQSAFTLNGWPDANAGLSTGYFELYDSATNVPIHTVASPNPGFTDNGNGVASLQPGVVFNNYRTIRVAYTFSENNSPSDGTGYYYIKVTPNPVANFSAASVLASAQQIDIGRPSAVNAYCENNLIEFTNTSTFPALGYIANTNPVWNIGVPSALQQFTPSASFTYAAHGRYIVTFSVSSQYNCPSQVVSDSIYVGAIPNVSFSMNGISTATQINVVDNSTVADGPGTNSSISSAQWKYGPSPTYTTNLNNTFTTPGHYTITLLSTTQIIRTDQVTPPPVALPGCERTFVRPVVIVPALNSATVGTENMDDFESTDPLKQWQPSSTNSLVSSWQKGDASESSSIELTSNVWATGLSSPYNSGEVSFLYSPAYDLSSLVRPKVSFDQIAFMNLNDGVVLEFSTDTFNIADPLKKWFRIGTNNDGNNWYNKSGLASKPGTQVNVVTGISSGDYGWSSVLDTVLHSQHTISPDIPAGKRTHVIFRFALSSLPGSTNEGFAFDNFRVGERTRVVLIENFTNAGNTNSINGLNIEKRESDELKSAKFNGVGTDVIKLNYHVGFPNLDPFNDDYPADPSARALFYNINETPLARMDGGKSTDPQKKYFSEWGVGLYNLRTLKLADADIVISNPVTSANGGFKFNVTVTAKTASRLAIDTTILHIAFVEANPILSNATDLSLVKTGETNFEYVVKQMIPSALGTRFDVTLQNGQSKTFGPFEWNPDLGKLYNATNDLAIVAFLQNEKTKEVYQAEILTALLDPTLVTDVEYPDYAERVHLFPNPANNEVNIQLPGAVSKSTPVEMFDTYGKSVYQSSFKAGEQVKTISTSELTGGVYFIQLATPDGNIVRRKIMVIHR